VLGTHVQTATALDIQLTQAIQAVLAAVAFVQLALAALGDQALGDHRSTDHLVASIVVGQRWSRGQYGDQQKEDDGLG